MSRLPVFTNRCCRLANEQLPTVSGTTSRRHRFPRLYAITLDHPLFFAFGLILQRECRLDVDRALGVVEPDGHLGHQRVIGAEQVAGPDLELEGRSVWGAAGGLLKGPQRWREGERSGCPTARQEHYLLLRLVREECFHERLEPEAVGVHTVPVPGFDGSFDPGNLGVRELELLGRQRERRVPEDALLAGDELALEVEGLLLVGCEGDLVLDGPDGADGGYVAALGAEAEWNLQGLE